MPDFVTHDSVRETFTDCPLPPNYSSDIIKPRNNTDKETNCHGELLTNLCKNCSLKLLNGMFLGDSLGYCTFHNFNGSSCVDYMLATNHVFHNVHYFKVLPPTELSDHSLICTSLKTIINNDRENYVNNNSKYSPVNGRFTWSDQCKYAYQTALVEEDSVNEILELNELIEDSNFSDMNKINYKLTDIYTKAASKTLQFKAPSKNS